MGPVRQFWPDPASQNQRKNWFYFAWGEYITESVSFREIKDEGKGRARNIFWFTVKNISIYCCVKGWYFPFTFLLSLVQPYHKVQRHNSGERGIGAFAGLKMLPVVEEWTGQAIEQQDTFWSLLSHSYSSEANLILKMQTKTNPLEGERGVCGCWLYLWFS